MPNLGVIALLLAAFLIGGLAGYLLGLLLPIRPKPWHLVVSAFLIGLLVVAAGLFLVRQQEPLAEATAARPSPTQKPATLTPEIPSPEPATAIIKSTAPPPISTATPVLPVDLDTVYGTFPFYAGQRRIYSFSSLTEVGGQTSPASESGRFSEEVVFVESGMSDRVRLVAVNLSREKPLGRCAAEAGPRDKWYIMDDTRLYMACTQQEAYAIAMDILAEPEQGTSERLLTPDFVVPLAVDNTWAWDASYPPNGSTDYRWHVQEKVDVVVPAGTFQDCFRIVLATLPDVTIKWVCPGQGLVAEEYHHHGDTRSYRVELAGYELP